MYLDVVYFLPVTKQLKVLPLTVMGQVLHHLLLHAVLPVLVSGAGVWKFALMSKSLRFGGLLNAINGGLCLACLSLSEVWRIDPGFLAIPPSLVRLGWYVVTRGIRYIGLPSGWGCSVFV